MKEKVKQALANLPRKQITGDHVKAVENVDNALTAYYDEVIEQAVQVGGTKEGDLRKWVDEVLILNGRRGVALAETWPRYKISRKSVAVLVGKHVLREQNWGDNTTWYELTHDRFIIPVTNANSSFRQQHRDEFTFIEYLESRATQAGAMLKEDELAQANALVKNNESSLLSVSEKVHTLIANTEQSLAGIKQLQAVKRLAIWLFWGLTFVFLLLAWLAWELEGAALQEQLAFKAERLQSTDPELGMMLSYAAYREPFLFGVFNTASRHEAQNAVVSSLLNSRLRREGQYERDSGVAFSANHQWLARNIRITGKDTYAVQVLSSATLSIHGLDVPASTATKVLAVSNDGDTIVLGDDGVRGVRISTVTRVIENKVLIPLFTGEVEQAAFTNDDRRLAMVMRLDGKHSSERVLIWDLESLGPFAGLQVFPSSLPKELRCPLFRTFVARQENLMITHIEFDREGTRLILACGEGGAAVISDRGEVQCWCKETEIGPVDRKNFIVWASTNKSGDEIITAGYDGLACVWKIAVPSKKQQQSAVLVSNPKLRSLRHRQTVCMASFDATGENALTSSDDGTVEIWDLRNDRVSQTFLGPSDGVIRSVFASDSEARVVCAIGQDGTIKTWDASPDFPPIWRDSLEKPLRCQGALIAAINANGTAFVTSRAEENENYKAQPDFKAPAPLPLLPAQAELSSARNSLTSVEPPIQRPNKAEMTTLDYSSRVAKKRSLSTSNIQNVAFSPLHDVNYFAYIEQTQEHGQVYVSEGKDEPPVQLPARLGTDVQVHPTTVGLLATTNQSSMPHTIAVGYSDGAVLIFARPSVSTGWVPQIIRNPQKDPSGKDVSVTAMACSPSETKFAVGMSDGNVVLFDENQAIGQAKEKHSKEVTALIFSTDGKRLVSGGSDGKLWIWSVEGSAQDFKWERKLSQFYEAKVISVSFGKNGQIAAVGGNGIVYIFPEGLHAGSEPLVFPVPFGVLAAGFCQDDTNVLLIDQEGWVRVFPYDAEWYMQVIRLRREAEGGYRKFLGKDEINDYFRGPFGDNAIISTFEEIAAGLHFVPTLPRELLAGSIKKDDPNLKEIDFSPNLF